MQSINISDFRANLLKYLERANSGEEISVTSNNKPLATIIAPVDQKDIAQHKLDSLSSTAKVHDVISPVYSDWDALS